MSTIPDFAADFPGAVVFPAEETNCYNPAQHGGVPNDPKVWVLHTPEEKADGYPGTPHWFATFHADPNQRGSTHYFVSYEGIVFQMVPETWGAIANGVKGKPYPADTDPSKSLNWQSVNVEIEGYAASIGDTLLVGGAQWDALVSLVRSRCDRYGIPMDRAHIIGHYEVASDRSDPGDGFPWDALLEAVMDAPTKAEFQALFAVVTELKKNIQQTFALALRSQTKADDALARVAKLEAAGK